MSRAGSVRVRRVEIVCTGNICRSPTAEVVLRAKLAEAGIDDVVVSSSGIAGWHVGLPMDDRAAAALARRGYDGSSHRAARFEPVRLSDRDLVLVMDSTHLAAIERRRGPGATARVALFADAEVPDPYHGTDADFEDVLDRIEKAADAIVTRLRRPDA